MYIADVGHQLKFYAHLTWYRCYETKGRGAEPVEPLEFIFLNEGHLMDGQLFYGIYGRVPEGSPYAGMVCNIFVRTDATDWRVEKESHVNFKIGNSIATRNHEYDFKHPNGTVVRGYTKIAGVAEITVMEA